VDVARLKSIPLFASLSDEEVGQIAPFAEEIEVPAGERLVNEGEFSYQFYAIEEGTAEVTRGGEHITDLGPGQFFGEMGLLERALRNATVVAKEPMRTITLTGWEMKRLEKANPEAVEQIRQVIEERKT
jgi:CRP-like cAMP-binding protein